VPWQRTLEDALALVAKTGKPLLICVNMDGEPASEQLAWVNYRDPEFVKLMRGFIPVIVSPDQRSPRDWDDHGRRLPDLRFGRVVNYEHITITPQLADRYFGDRQVAPRHIGVNKDGVLLFDIFLTRGFDEVVEALKKYGKPDAHASETKPADMTEADLLESPDASHRDELEARFWNGNEATRVRIASAALSKDRNTQHPEILRMAVLGSAAVRKAAVTNIAAHIDRAPEWLWLPAFRACGRDPALLEVLESALLGLSKPKAAELGKVIQGLRTRAAVDVERWLMDLARAKPETPLKLEELPDLEKQLDELDGQIRDKPSAELHLRLAEATLRYARMRILQREDPTFLLKDVCTHAKEANKTNDLGIRGRAVGLEAWARDLLDEGDNAGRAACAALPLLSPSASSLGRKVLEVCVQRGKQTGPVHAAYEVLIFQADCSEQRLLQYLKWLQVIGAYGFQDKVLERGLSLFPVSGALHEYLRYQQLRDGGAESLERRYARMKPSPEHTAQIQWYSGLASLQAAERHVQNRRSAAAIASYERAVQQMAASGRANPAYADSAHHWMCLADSGRARVLADSGRWRDAGDAIQKSLGIRPLSKDTKDNLGNTPVQNASYIYNGLLDAGEEGAAKGLQEAVLRHGVKVERRAVRGRFRRRG